VEFGTPTIGTAARSDHPDQTVFLATWSQLPERTHSYGLVDRRTFGSISLSSAAVSSNKKPPTPLCMETAALRGWLPIRAKTVLDYGILRYSGQGKSFICQHAMWLKLQNLYASVRFRPAPPLINQPAKVRVALRRVGSLFGLSRGPGHDKDTIRATMSSSGR
jgi:hypothetical protein